MEMLAVERTTSLLESDPIVPPATWCSVPVPVVATFYCSRSVSIPVNPARTANLFLMAKVLFFQGKLIWY